MSVATEQGSADLPRSELDSRFDEIDRQIREALGVLGAMQESSSETPVAKYRAFLNTLAIQVAVDRSLTGSDPATDQSVAENVGLLLEAVRKGNALIAPRKGNRKIAAPWSEGTPYPMPNIQNHGTSNLAAALAGGAKWTNNPASAAELIAIRNGQAVCRIDLTPGQEDAERKLLSALGPRAIKTMVAVSRLVYEKTNRQPLNHGATLTVGEVARGMGYEPGRDRTIHPEILQNIGLDLRALSKIETFAADGPFERKTRSRPSAWIAPLIVIKAVHVKQTGPDGAVLPYEFDAELGRNWGAAFARTDILQVAPNFMELTEDNPIRLGWYYMAEFRYAMTRTKEGLSRKIPALCDAAGIDTGESKNRGRFLDRLERWHDELQIKGVIGFHRRTPGLDTDRTPGDVFAEAEYFVRPPQAILDAYKAPREQAAERRRPRAKKAPG